MLESGCYNYVESVWDRYEFEHCNKLQAWKRRSNFLVRTWVLETYSDKTFFRFEVLQGCKTDAWKKQEDGAKLCETICTYAVKIIYSINELPLWSYNLSNKIVMPHGFPSSWNSYRHPPARKITFGAVCTQLCLHMSILVNEKCWEIYL